MELIKISENAEGQSVVSARELHIFLQVQTEFPKWCERMFEYGFVENQDFNSVKIDEVRLEGKRQVKRQIIDYALTIDCAKHIAMVQRTERGMQARNYFLKCEKELRNNLAIEAGKLQALLAKLESVWLTFALAKQQLDVVDCGFDEMAKDLEDLPTTSLETNAVFMTVAEFFKQRGVELRMEDIAYYNRFCKNYARRNRLRTASAGAQTISFTLPTLEEAWREYKSNQPA